MYVWLVAGLASFLIPAPRAPKIHRPMDPSVASVPLKIAKPGRYDFAGKIFVMGKVPKRVVEYGTPSLQVMAMGVSVQNFAWRGSMESLHVGSEPFTPKGMRQRHSALRVTLENLFCDDVGEDCVSIQPRAQVTIRDSQFQGQYLLTKGSSDGAGLDKLVQIDGAKVTMEHCDFYNGVRAVRGKANSVIALRGCRFVGCETAITGDGDFNPRASLFDLCPISAASTRPSSRAAIISARCPPSSLINVKRSPCPICSKSAPPPTTTWRSRP